MALATRACADGTRRLSPAPMTPDIYLLRRRFMFINHSRQPRNSFVPTRAFQGVSKRFTRKTLPLNHDAVAVVDFMLDDLCVKTRERLFARRERRVEISDFNAPVTRTQTRALER